MSYVTQPGSTSPGKDAVLIGIGSTLNQISSFLFVVFMARTLEVKSLGVALVCISTATLVAAVADFGTNSKWMIDLSNKSLSPEEWFGLAISKIGICLLSASVVILFCPQWELETIPILAISICLMSHQTLLVYLKVFNLNRWYAILLGAERAIALLLLSISWLAFHNSSNAYWLSLSLGTAISSAIALTVIISKLGFRRLDFLMNLRRFSPWRKSLSYAVTSLVGATRTLDVNLVGGLAGSYSAGIFGAVSKWFQPLIVGSGITSTITTPWIASKIKLNRLQLFKASAPVILTVVASSLILINPNWLIISLLGSGFSESAGLVYGLFGGSVFSGLSVIWGSWAQAIGKSRPIATISAVQVCIQFGIGSLAIVNLGIYAYVAVAALSQIFAAISSIVVYSRANSKN